MSVTKQMVHLADNEQDTTQVSFAEIAETKDTPVVSAENVVYRLKDKSKRGRVHIDGCADAWNPKLDGGKGRMDRIWLLTGAQTIWQTELGEVLKDKDYIRSNKRSLIFEGGVLRIPLYDKLAIEFAEAAPHFMGGKDHKTTSKTPYYKWDPEKQQREAMAKKMLGVQMVAIANTQPVEKMRRHAFYLGINGNDEMGIPKTDDGIRLDYMMYASDNPETFKASLDSKEVDVRYMVRRAILEAKIDIGSGKGKVKWAKTGGYIATVPNGFEATAYLTELALTNSEEGKVFLDQLQENSK